MLSNWNGIREEKQIPFEWIRWFVTHNKTQCNTPKIERRLGEKQQPKQQKKDDNIP